MPRTFAEIIKSPEFQALSLEEQRSIRQDYLTKVVMDERFIRAPDEEQKQIRQFILSEDEPSSALTTAALAKGKQIGERAGFGKPGFIESFLPESTERGNAVRDVVRGVDTGIKLLNILPAAIGQSAKDVTEIGGATLGKALHAIGLAPEEATVPRTTPISQGAGLIAEIASPFAILKRPRATPLVQKVPSRELAAKTEPWGEFPRQGPPQPGAVERVLAEPTEIKPALDSVIAQFTEDIASVQSRLTTLQQKGKTLVDPAQNDKVPRRVLEDRVAEQLLRIERNKNYAAPKPPRAVLEHAEAKPPKLDQATSNTRTLEAAQDLMTGRVLDLGEAGRRRAIERGLTQTEESRLIERAAGMLPPEKKAIVPRPISGGSDLDLSTIPLRKNNDTPFMVQAKLYFTKHLGTPFFDLPVMEVVRGTKAEPLVRSVFAAHQEELAIAGWFINNVTRIYKPVKNSTEAVHRVGKALDGGGLAGLSAEELSVHKEARALLDKAAELLGLAPGRRLTDYFPHIREQVTRELAIRLQVTDEKYIPVRIKEFIPKEILPFFLRERSLDAPAMNLGIEPLLAYGRGFARSIIMNGGTNPFTNKPVRGLLETIKKELPNVPRDMSWYITDYMNDILDVPKNMSRVKLVENETTEKLIRSLRAMEFVRTIGLNPLSPAQNLTQSFNTWSRSSVGSFFRGLIDMHNPALQQLAEQHGITGVLTKADLGGLDTARLPRAIESLSRTTFVFKWSEKQVRLHAFATGLRDAAKNGLVGDEAIEFARRLVDTTQYQFGREAVPAAFRTRGYGQTITQYKPYTLNQMGFIKDLFADAIKGRPLPLMKYLTITVGVFGSEATMLGIDKWLGKALLDNEKALTFEGFFPKMGIFVANQMGLNALPVEDYRSFLFFLPGPFISHMADLVSLAAGREFNPVNMTATNWGQPLTYEQAAAKAFRAIPLAGVFANRIRRAVVEWQTLPQGKIFEPQSWTEALGLSPATGSLVRTQSPSGMYKTAAGVQTPEYGMQIARRKDEADLMEAFSRSLREMAQQRFAGRHEEANAIAKKFKADYGVDIHTTPEAIRAAAKRRVFTPEERLVRQGPRQLRSTIREMIREDLE